MSITTVTPTQTGVRVSIPMKVRKARGKTQILLPGVPRYIGREPQRDYQEAVAVAVARGHLWCEMLQSGKFSSLRKMAAKFGLCESYMARLIRMASLAPDIVEAILNGNEPRGFSLSMLIRAVPEVWQEQRKEYGFYEQPGPVRQILDFVEQQHCLSESCELDGAPPLNLPPAWKRSFRSISRKVNRRIGPTP